MKNIPYLRNYGERLSLLTEKERKYLLEAMTDEKTLSVLEQACRGMRPIRVEVGDHVFPMSSMEDLHNLREELDLKREVAA